MVIIRINDIFYLDGSNNVKYIINPNNNHWVVLNYRVCNLYTYIKVDAFLHQHSHVELVSPSEQLYQFTEDHNKF
jgi:hypothetical protein